METIARCCDACQRFSQVPVCFSVSLQRDYNIVVGDKLSTDIIFLDGGAVVHILNTDIRFSAATFLDKQSATLGKSEERIWLPFVTTWFLVCFRYPNRLQRDQGFVVTFDRWKQLSGLNGIQLCLYGVEVFFPGIVEHYNDHLQSIYRKIRYTHFSFPPQNLLKIAV